MGARVRRQNPDLAAQNYVEICLDCGGWRLKDNGDRSDDQPWGPPKWGETRPASGSIPPASRD
jgi:hypothetical protein